MNGGSLQVKWPSLLGRCAVERNCVCLNVVCNSMVLMLDDSLVNRFTHGVRNSLYLYYTNQWRKRNSSGFKCEYAQRSLCLFSKRPERRKASSAIFPGFLQVALTFHSALDHKHLTSDMPWHFVRWQNDDLGCYVIWDRNFLQRRASKKERSNEDIFCRPNKQRGLRG